VLRLRSEVPGRGVADGHSGGADEEAGRGSAQDGDRRVHRDRLRRPRARRFPARARHGRAVPERGEHDSRLHDDQHVLEAVGSERRGLPEAARSADRAGDRTPRGEAAVTHLDVTRGARWLIAGWLAVAGAAAVAASGLTEAPRLAAVYDSILGAQFDRAEAQLAATCPPAPAEACAALRAESVWWQIQIDPDDRALDARLETLAAAAINAAGAWTEREPKRAEAWFYLAAAYTPLVQLRVLRHERMSAARAGSKIKDALEQALALDPGLTDAHLGIGLYRYYAAVAPLYTKLLRWLLLLPGGDRADGHKEIRLARDRGALLAGEADYQLAL